ncbi:MAG: uncharacterized protein SRB1_00080 [Desulfobacteraceae bacterium Eth-SRB1]|nr:MAG: uncharacterized protein SRB1_00080 [Desulfobacteraceae bacterium Eth-SRB1]
MNILIKIISFFICLYFAYCGILFLMQRYIMFPRIKISEPSNISNDMPDLEKNWINAGCEKIETWFIPPLSKHDQGPRPAVIFAHGNAEIIDQWPEPLKKFTEMGIGVLLVEYPGYGRSKGSPSQKSITEAFVAAYDVLIAREDVDPSRIILLGRSIGGGAICALAAERPSAMLILMSSFISTRSMASKYLVPGFFALDPFDNISTVRSYPGTVLVIHGKNDELIPYKHGVALSNAAKRGRILTYNCGHNDCPPDWDIFREDIKSILQETGIINNDKFS